METVIKKEKYTKIPYIVSPKSRVLLWRKLAGMLKGKIKNPAKKMAQIRAEWDRY